MRCGYDPPRCLHARKRIVAATSAMALLLVGYAGTQDYFEAAAFVVRAAGMTGVARRAAALEADAVTEAPVTISWRDGQLRGRTYTPVGSLRPADPARPRRACRRHRRTAPDQLRPRDRRHGPPGPHRGADRSGALPDHPAHDRHDRRRRRLGDPVLDAGDARARPGRGNHRDQLRRRPLGRRRARGWANGWAGCCRSAATATCRARCATSAPASSRTAGCGRRTTTGW